MSPPSERNEEVIPSTTGGHSAPRHLTRQPPSDGPDEERLLSRAILQAKEGDTSALHYLYVRYADDVYGYVKSIVRDSYEAEDITHNVFAKLMTAIRRYETRSVPFTGWLLRIARNAAIDHLRAARAVPCEEVRAADEQDEQVQVELWHSLTHALDLLPHEQRHVLVLRHIAGLSPGEIAEKLGKSESAVHGLHHRGRGALQDSLRDLDATPVTAGPQ
jgi:RNA polymerase sigma-70 factor, ECF subfamily